MFIFVLKLLLPEGQTGTAWEPVESNVLLQICSTFTFLYPSKF